MNAKKSCALLTAFLLLTGCAPEVALPITGDESPSSAVSSAEVVPPVQVELPEGETLEDWSLSDFSTHFLEEYSTEREEYTLLEGEELENTVHVLRGAEEGPSVYLVSGLHGDELAGWYAGTLLRDCTIKAGTLYLIAPANTYGAVENQRRTKDNRDANRYFPGDAQGWDAEQIAASIYGDIEDKAPDIVLDLHEAHTGRAGYDALGNTVICESLDGIGDMVFALIVASEVGEVGSSPLSLYSAPPNGSINQIVTRELKIPTMTVESYREEPIAQRVDHHLGIVEFVLEQYEMR